MERQYPNGDKGDENEQKISFLTDRDARVVVLRNEHSPLRKWIE